MGGVANGDVISYYVVTQDVSTAKSLVSFPAGVVATDVLNITTHTVPNTYVIGAPLPVKLVSFAVKANNKDADVKWVVSEEINIAQYEVERSSDGNSFTVAGRVMAGNKKQYGFTDKNLASGIYYYRLKTIDVAGSAAYSHIEKIKAGSINKLSIYPNPVVNGQLFIQLPAATTVNIYNSNGLMVLHRQLGVGAHTLVVTTFARGTYLLKTSEEEATFIVQ
jgi:hypothetical protein